MSNESRNSKFRRLAEKRMTRIYETMNLIANLSNKANYLYNENDVNMLFRLYQKKGIEIKNHFEESSNINNTISKIKLEFDSKIDINSKKRKKFVELLTKRMEKIFDDMDLIANLSNRKNYTYKKEEVEELFEAYEEKGEEIRMYFEPLKEKFSFKTIE